jgi:hypothetical protein
MTALRSEPADAVLEDFLAAMAKGQLAAEFLSQSLGMDFFVSKPEA